MEHLPEHLFLKIGASSLWVTRELAGDPGLTRLADPDSLLASPDCKIIKDQKKIKVGRLRLELGGQQRGIYLKRYNVFSWRYRLGSLFTRSAAYHSLRGAEFFIEAGFNVAPPLAAVEERRGRVLQKSFYISGEIPKSFTLGEFWAAKAAALDFREIWRLQRCLITEAAALFQSLHRKKIYHNDLKEANILVREEAGLRQYYFTDLERAVGRRLSCRRKVKNLVQIDRTLGRKFSRGRRLAFLMAYLGDGFKNKSKRRRWIFRIVREGRRRDLRSLAKQIRKNGLSWPG